MIDTQINPFDPTVSQDEVNRLFRKLKDTRLPEYPIVPDSADNDDYGAPLDWARRLKEYWETQYDWTKAQNEICSWHHFKTRIEGIDIHFVHEKAAASSSAKPIPLLLVHGWPGSFYEFSRVIGPLTSPPSADAGPAFDVVVVSLPGFAWSGPPPRRGWTLQDSARVFDTLMGRLGYFSYCAQGGDWAHFVLRELGSGRFPACRAVHTNMCPSEPPVAPGEEPTSREKWAGERLQWWLGSPRAERHMGFAVEMRTRPQTLGVALNDSPVGIMMWVGEKYNELTDPERCADLQDPEFNHRLATTLCLYFFTPPSIMTSMLCYYENVRHEDYAEFNLRPENRITVPMGFTSYKWDTSPTSERTVATTGNVKWFKERDYGGHFAALETPQEMVDDLRSFCGQWYSE